MSASRNHPVRRLLAALVLSASGIVAHAAQSDPVAASRYYEDGLARYEKQDLPGAVIQLKNALQQDRNMLAAHLLLGRSYFDQGELGAAEVSFREALRLGASRAEVAVPLARIYLLQGRASLVVDGLQPEGLPPAAQLELLSLRGTAYANLGKGNESERSFAAARALDSNSPVPLVAEVPVLLGSGKPELARERAERAVQLAPRDAAAYNVRASVAHATGRLPAALEDYARAIELQPGQLDARVARAGILLDLGRDAEAASVLDKLGADMPKEPRVAYLRALLASRRGDSATANAQMLQVGDLLENLPAEWLATQEQLLMTGALAHHATGQFEKARKYLDVLVARYPRNLGARKLLAAVLVERNETTPAQALLEDVLRKQPDDAQALYLLGRVQLAQKRYAKAAETLERAAARGAAEDPRLQTALGLGRVGMGDTGAGLRSLAAAFDKTPQDVGLAATYVNLLMRGGERAKAVAVARKTVQAQAANPAAHNLLGLALASNDDLPAARNAYNEALKRDAGFVPAQLNLARVDRAEGKLDAARQRYAAMLAKDRNDGVALYESGALEQQAGNTAEALRWFEKAVVARPDNIAASLALAEARLAAGEGQAALEAMRTLTLRRPGDLAALAELARIEQAVGDTRAAQQTLREMSRIAEYDPDAQVRIGYLQLRAGAADEAARNAQKALQGRPDHIGALTLAAEAALARGEFDKAGERVRELRRLDPKAVDALRVEGDIAFARGQLPAAAEAYRQAQERQPSAELLLRRVQVLLAQGKPAAAAPLLQQWLKDKPEPAVRRALAEIHMRTGDWAAARREYERLITEAPTDASAYNNLANVQIRMKDGAAVATAQKALALAPADPNVIDTLGWALARGERYEDALRYLRDARLRAPDNAEVRWHLAYVLARVGRAQEARDELDGALRLSSTFDGAEEARRLRLTL